MTTPNITAKDIGNGNNMEIVTLIPMDTPSHREVSLLMK
jgi:hypothetical protein